MSTVKLIGVGDLHIKIRGDVPLAWQTARFRSFVETLVTACKDQDAILILAGDQLDSIEPKKEEIQLFLYLLGQLEAADIPTVLVSGNHETIAEGDSILDYLEVTQFTNICYRSPLLNYRGTGVNVYPVNHDALTMPRLDSLRQGFNVLASHFRSDYNKFVREELDVAEFTAPYDLCVAGDIHDAFHFGNVWYTNNPLNKDFETSPTCGWLEVSIDTEQAPASCNVFHRRIEFPELRQIECTATEWPPQIDGRHFYKIQVSGSVSELRDVKNQFPNAKVVRAPVTEHALPTEVMAEGSDISLRDGDLENDLMTYVSGLGWGDDTTASMGDVFREVIL